MSPPPSHWSRPLARIASPRLLRATPCGPGNRMVFRATQKLSSKLRVAYATIAESHSPMVEWYCNLITVRRRQFFLFTHAPSLFSFWVPAAGTTRDDFGRVFRRHAA